MPTYRQSRSVGVQRALCALMVVVCLLMPVRVALANDVRITNLTVHPYNGGDSK